MEIDVSISGKFDLKSSLDMEIERPDPFQNAFTYYCWVATSSKRQPMKNLQNHEKLCPKPLPYHCVFFFREGTLIKTT